MWDTILESILIPWQEIVYVLISLLLAVFCGTMIAFIYKITHRETNGDRSFLFALVALPPIVTTVMLVIQGNLVFALALIAALSIVRFRIPIKDIRGWIFLFWTITAGLGAGTNNWTITLLATIILAIVMCILDLIQNRHIR